MLKFDRKKFFDGYRSHCGPLTQDLVDALELLLGEIENDTRFPGTDTDRRKLAYCLATFQWETAHTMKPIDEHGSPEYFESRYGPETKVGKRLGNTQPGDGSLFHGRGYVQLTGRNNYERAGKLTNTDLLVHPDQAKEPQIAYQIAIQGMIDGWFTGKKLKQFVVDDAPPDFENARTIINGHDKAQVIADIARRFDETLLFAKI
ncbi:MAG: glycoside hydrolase family 19 protein [Syntrophales bacterium]